MTNTLPPAEPPVSYEPGPEPPDVTVVRVRLSKRARVIIAAVLIALVVLAGYFIYRANATFTMNGTMETTSRSAFQDSCVAWGHPHAGDDVTVYNSVGVAVGFTHLDEGTPSMGSKCTYTFTVPKLPVGEPSYGVEVQGFSKTVVTPDRAEHPQLYDEGYGG